MNTTSLVVVVTGLHTPLWKLIFFTAVLGSLVLGLLCSPIGMLLEDRRQARSAQQGHPEDAPLAAPLTSPEPPLDVVLSNKENDDVLTHS